MINSNYFDQDYYERGIESGKSCYTNYRWVPELTIPMAMTIIDYLKIKRGHTVMDYGCSKGYLVKALRLLYRQAWGIDISSYAIKNVDKEAKKFCSKSDRFLNFFDICIAKDVFEHISAEDIATVLKCNISADILFAVIPLGEGGEFRADANNHDQSHLICANEKWWIETFKNSGWQLKKFTFRVDGIKDSYYKTSPEAHGFFTLKKGV